MPTDEEFERAWADLDNTRMMRHVAGPYRPHMTEEEWLQLQRLGLMNALRSHDPSSRRKFISSLRLRTLWVFKTNARGAFRKKRLKDRMLVDPPRPVQSECGEIDVDLEDTLSLLMDELTPDEKMVVAHRYLDDMSLSEISRRTGVPRARIGKLHQSGIFKLRYLADKEI